jgi:hypothetical protein
MFAKLVHASIPKYYCPGIRSSLDIIGECLKFSQPSIFNSLNFVRSKEIIQRLTEILITLFQERWQKNVLKNLFRSLSALPKTFFLEENSLMASN